MKHLESILRSSIVEGQQGDGLVPWTKIIVIVEGIYSMEGTIVNLPEVIRLKNKYRAYLYMDEAHSIGAMGPRGRGICDYYGCDPKQIDMLMGTFTKSFAAAGGYIAGSRTLIEYIRANSPSFYYANTMAPPIVEQISNILDEFMLMDEKNGSQCQTSQDDYYQSYFQNVEELSVASPVGGTETDHDESNQRGTKDSRTTHQCSIQSRIIQLRKNAVYFRQNLKRLGFHIDGHDDSPVVPIMVYSPSNLK